MKRDPGQGHHIATAWKVRGRVLSLARPLIMGIVNVTPDSFSDGGQHPTFGTALAHALRLVEEGADILDIGGESTRPGAAAVPPREQLRRLLPVLKRLKNQSRIPVSVDTTSARVAEAAIGAGVQMVNDVSALRSDPEMPAAAIGGGSVWPLTSR